MVGRATASRCWRMRSSMAIDLGGWPRRGPSSRTQRSAVATDRLLCLLVHVTVPARAVGVGEAPRRAEQAERSAATRISNHCARHARRASALTSRRQAHPDLAAERAGGGADLVGIAVGIGRALIGSALVVRLLLHTPTERGDGRDEARLAHALAVQAVAAQIDLRGARGGFHDWILADAVATGRQLDATPVGRAIGIGLAIAESGLAPRAAGHFTAVATIATTRRATVRCTTARRTTDGTATARSSRAAAPRSSRAPVVTTAHEQNEQAQKGSLHRGRLPQAAPLAELHGRSSDLGQDCGPVTSAPEPPRLVVRQGLENGLFATRIEDVRVRDTEG